MTTERPMHLAVQEIEATFEVFGRVKFYPDFVKLFVPSQPIQKIKEGYELRNREQYKSNVEKTNTEPNSERSLRRTISVIKDYVTCNDFELFVTLTFGEDRHNAGSKRKQMGNWLKNQQKRKGQFEYLIVMELHKDGAVHFHGLLKNYKGELKPSRSSKTGKLLTKRGKQVYELPSYTLGFTNVQIIKGDDKAKVARYITKYITKDMPTLPGKNRFWVSERLASPLVVYNPPAWVYDEVPVFTHSSDYGTTSIIPYSSKLDDFRTRNALPGGATPW